MRSAVVIVSRTCNSDCFPCIDSYISAMSRSLVFTAGRYISFVKFHTVCIQPNISPAAPTERSVIDKPVIAHKKQSRVNRYVARVACSAKRFGRYFSGFGNHQRFSCRKRYVAAVIHSRCISSYTSSGHDFHLFCICGNISALPLAICLICNSSFIGDNKRFA